MKSLLATLTFFLFHSFAATAQKQDSIVLSNAVLYYSVHGNGQPILLLSGGPGLSSDNLFELFEQVSKRYKCILFDQRGTGKSHTEPLDSSTINLNQSFNDINSLLEKLKISKVTIIGHSWGAMLGMSYAIKYPDRVSKLVSVGSGPLGMSDYHIIEEDIMSKASKEERNFMDQAQDSMAHHTASRELMRSYSRILLRLFLYDSRKLDSIVEFLKKGSQNDAMQGLMLQDLAKIKYDIKPGVAKLQMPLLALCGRQDPVGIFPTIMMSQLNKKVKTVWIERSGHFPWLEQSDTFYSALFDFLK